MSHRWAITLASDSVRPDNYTAPSTKVVYSDDAFEKAIGHHFNVLSGGAQAY